MSCLLRPLKAPEHKRPFQPYPAAWCVHILPCIHASGVNACLIYSCTSPDWARPSAAILHAYGLARDQKDSSTAINLPLTVQSNLTSVIPGDLLQLSVCGPEMWFRSCQDKPHRGMHMMCEFMSPVHLPMCWPESMMQGEKQVGIWRLATLSAYTKHPRLHVCIGRSSRWPGNESIACNLHGYFCLCQPGTSVELPISLSKLRRLVQFRLGSHDLPIEQGRMVRPVVPRYLRQCSLCSWRALGDERHFMLECP